ncbi:MAG TPA: polysaccharide deacetylase family protein [Solirubrobacteraceae bacterium]|jgi:peptidoglycan/xylan/chitin deacetylase (PgdA/CDA1 family)|nr:polysaccharide deacetylase family protein [Solirubrobacteraceae bacterium]
MESGDAPDALDRDALRARREAARARRRRARLRGLAVLGAALAVLVAAVVALAGAGGGGGTKPGSASPAALNGGTATSGSTSKKGTQGSPANLDALVAAGKPVYCGGGHQRLVALTFDDGPGPYTNFALDQLGRAQVRATWFLVGRNLQTFASLPPKEMARGELADHSWTHPPLTALAPDAATSEIQRTRDAVSAIAGRPIRMFRPPYGLRNASIDDTVRRLGMVNVIWNVDSLDSAGADKHRIAATVIANLRPGAIVLMHENRGQTIQALHKILPALSRKKLQAVPLSELLQRDPPSRAQLDRGPDGCPKQTGGGVSAGG